MSPSSLRRFGPIALLAACALFSDGAAAQPPTEYKPGAGPHAVQEVAELVLHDAARGKDLPLRLYFPKEPGRYPVVVFSHGAGGSKDCCAELARHWASHGYVVLQPTHEDSVQLQRAEDRGRTALEAMQQALRDLSTVEFRRGRTGDVAFLLDSLEELERRVPGLRGKIDAARIGVSGHSAGALTAQLLGGAQPAGEDSYADPRAKAFLLLSAQGRGRLGFDDDSWKNFQRPMMNVTGSLDRGLGNEPPAWRKEPYDFAPPGDKFHLDIRGAHHGTFIGNLTGGALERLRGERYGLREQQQLFGWVRMAAIAYWDACLKDESAARAWLLSGALAELSRNAATLLHK